MSDAVTPPAAAAVPPDSMPVLEDRDMEPRTPMKRLGSTRKLAAFNNIRMQLCEQTRVVEARAEATAGVAGELHEYCRRRGEVEAEYARALDKLARAASARHEAARSKREQWAHVGAHACWLAALESTRTLAREHAALGTLYGGPLAARLARAQEDCARLHRKCRDVLVERHEEVGAALHAAAAAGKAHAAAHLRHRAAALKLRAALDARNDPPKHKKIKTLDKELEKRRQRHSAARAGALRARAEYALSLEAANATLQRYYLDDVGDVILCMEVGFEAVVGRCVRCACAAERACDAAGEAARAPLAAAAAALDALQDRQRVLGAHAAAFALPRPLAAPPPEEARAVDALLGEAGRAGLEAEAEAEGEAEVAVREELAQRTRQLEAAARALRAECRENAKTLDAAEAELVKQMEGSDSQWDVSGLFGAGVGAAGGGCTVAPMPPPTDDQEDYYLAKFRAYVSCAGRLARVESKAAALRGRLGAGAAVGVGAAAAVPRRAARGRHGGGGFAAPLDLALPRVLTECVRVIATHGLRHQGVFRVSGSQVEMAALRAAFERGEEPLTHADSSDVNSVCGLLKLYLREIRPPLVPPQLQERLLRVAALPEDAQWPARLGAVLAALPLPALLVLRYLFAFLAHLAENSAYTMMDAWNLAVCVGPTLLAAWGDPPRQLHNQNLVNELVKRAILHHRHVFPQDVAPHALYRRPGESTDGAEERGEEVDGAGGDVGGDLEQEPVGGGVRGTVPGDDSDTEEETSSECEGDEWAERQGAAGSGPGSLPPALAPAHHEVPTDADAASEPAPPPGPGPGPAPAPASASGHSDPAHVSVPSCRRLAESTPDLVLDLPSRPPPPASPGADGPPATPPPLAGMEAGAGGDSLAADTFAHNRDTLKKRPAHKQTRSEGGAATCPGDGEVGIGSGGGAGGSPVPARNTLRVAAKFAELTLTGGSLKPALAAKPALLRRPTPHPHPPPRASSTSAAPTAAPAPEGGPE